jgi:Family of unknown function (DUF6529)
MAMNEFDPQAATATAPQAPNARRPSPATVLLVPALAGCAVSLALGIYGHLHNPTGVAVDVIGFSGPLSAKTWLATVATLLAIVQIVSAMIMYGKLPWITAPSWIGGLHRWSGRIAFITVVPVAMHCLYALGYQTYSTRVMIHSLLGCVFFGVFTAKMLVLTKKDAPGWVLPVLGGVLFAVLVGLWFSSAYWFFTTFGIKR